MKYSLALHGDAGTRDQSENACREYDLQYLTIILGSWKMNNACRFFSTRPRRSRKQTENLFKTKLSPEATSRCSTHTTENYKRRVADKAFWHLWTQSSELRTTGRESLYQIRTSPAPEEEKQKLQSEHQGIDHYRIMGAILLPVCFWTGFHLLSV